MDITFLENIFKYHYLLVHLPAGFLIIAYLLMKHSSAEEELKKIILKKISIVLCILMSLLIFTGLGLAWIKNSWRGVIYLHMVLGALGLFSSFFLMKLGPRLQFIPLILIIGSLLSGNIAEFGSSYFLKPLEFSEKSYNSAGIIPDQAKYEFDSKIKLILDKKCVQCHNAEDFKGKLNLTELSSIFKGGVFQRFYSPGNIDESGFFLRINENVLSEKHMPYLSGRLSKTEISLIRKWIEKGGFSLDESKKQEKDLIKADHWAFQRPEKPFIDKNYRGNEIDYFVNKRRETEGEIRVERISSGSLLRKLSLVTKGLIPELEEAQNFKLSQYNEKVDEYLDSKHLGENYAAFWLDIFGFAETSGYTITRITETSSDYRDFIIKSFNEDFSYLPFLKEQLYFTGKDIEDASYDYKNLLLYLPIHRDPYVSADLALNTITSTTLGLEMRCARCHDHKYDPISNDQYYSALASFQGLYEMKEMDFYKLRKNKGEPISQAFLNVFEGAKSDLDFWVKKREGKAKDISKKHLIIDDYANWLIDTKDGVGFFTARSFVDHIWRFVFGKGLIPTPSNMGMSGRPSSYPDLLNWLTYDFIEKGTSFKYLLRKILRSSAFQTRLKTKKEELRLNIFRRLDTESIRDSLLSFSGVLNKEMYGKSITSEPSIIGKDSNDSVNRRSIYYLRSREKMTLFSRNLGIPRGYGSTALRNKKPNINETFFFLNKKYLNSILDETVKKNHIKYPSFKDELINSTYYKLFTRAPNKKELNSWRKFFRENNNYFESMRMFFHILISSNEFIYTY